MGSWVLMNERWVRLLLRVAVSLAVASAISICVAYVSFWGSVFFFAHLYPYDGQDGLGSIAVGLIGGMFAWVGAFYVVFNWQRVRARLRQPPPWVRSVEQTDIYGRTR